MIQEILKFKKIQRELPLDLAKSKYKASFIIQEMGLSRATYYRKLKTSTFTADEMLLLLKITQPEEYYRWKFEKQIDNAEQEISEGKTVEAFETLAELTK